LTWLGEEKIPDPMIKPTISDNPFRYVNVLCFSSDPPPSPPPGCAAAVGAPMGAYAATVVDDKGKRFAAKSKPDETENDRPWKFGRPPAAGLSLSNGSSRSSEAFREDDILGLESVSPVDVPGLELARDASSRESRLFGWKAEL
jgi:hypothetical protein